MDRVGVIESLTNLRSQFEAVANLAKQYPNDAYGDEATWQTALNLVNEELDRVEDSIIKRRNHGL